MADEALRDSASFEKLAPLVRERGDRMVGSPHRTWLCARLCSGLLHKFGPAGNRRERVSLGEIG